MFGIKKIIVTTWQCLPLIVSEKQKPWFCLFCCLWVWGFCEIWEKYAMETDKKQTCSIFICCEEYLPFLPHWSVRAILHFWSTHGLSLHVDLAWMTLNVLSWGSCSSWKCKGGRQSAGVQRHCLWPLPAELAGCLHLRHPEVQGGIRDSSFQCSHSHCLLRIFIVSLTVNHLFPWCFHFYFTFPQPDDRMNNSCFSLAGESLLVCTGANGKAFNHRITEL